MNATKQQYSNKNRLNKRNKALKNKREALTTNLLNGNIVVVSPTQHFNLTGDSHFNKKDYANAINFYQKSLGIDPNQANISYIIGIASELQGLTNARDYFITALKLNPELIMSDNALNKMLVQSKNFSDLVQWYINEAETNFDSVASPNLYFQLGCFCNVKNDIDNAIKCFQIVIKLNSNYSRAYFNLGILYDTKGLLDESITSLIKTIDLEPQFAEAYFTIGHKYFKKLDFYRSALCFNFAGNFDPKYKKPNLSLGNIYQDFFLNWQRWK